MLNVIYAVLNAVSSALRYVKQFSCTYNSINYVNIPESQSTEHWQKVSAKVSHEMFEKRKKLKYIVISCMFYVKRSSWDYFKTLIYQAIHHSQKRIIILSTISSILKFWNISFGDCLNVKLLRFRL